MKGFVFRNKVTQTEMIPTSQKGVALNNNGVKAIKIIEEKKNNFNKRDIKRAEALGRFQYVSRHSSDATLHHTTMTNGVKNSLFVP